MKETLKILNELEQRGCFRRYAVGGAMAATFYVEPVLTYDLDVFVLLADNGRLDVLAPIYTVLHEMGFEPQGECIEIRGTPVQFLPVYNDLLEEAVAEAVETDYDGVPTRVLAVEYLLAVCVQTGRTKDRDRVRLILEQADVDHEALRKILLKHGLAEKWDAWNTRNA